MVGHTRIKAFSFGNNKFSIRVHQYYDVAVDLFCVVAGLSFALRDDYKSMSFSSVVIGSLGVREIAAP